MRVARLLLFGVIGVSGCGQHGSLDLLPASTLTPTPTATLTPTPTPTPTAIPTPTPDFGDGHDGPLTVATPVIVNQCRDVVSASGATVNVGDAAPFPMGRRILVQQAQADFAAVADAADVTAATMGGAGLWEIGRVQSVVGNTLTLSAPLGATYSSAGTVRAQACTVPEYTNVTLNLGGRIDASAWDGDRGGVIAFYANGVAAINGTLDADSAGFRGGGPSQNSGAIGEEGETTNSFEGAQRGEGLDGRSLGANGRGNRANAGGGGNAHNAGGGGGGGAGEGGFGGFQGEGNAENPATRGRGGRAVVLAGAERLVLGGGGGGGHQDNNGGADGGRGGGAIVIYANDLQGTGSFDVDGETGFDSGIDDADGAGGGGGGGMIVLHVGVSTFSGVLTANGGFGGTSDGDEDYGSGPGGGGGGGRRGAPAVVTTASTIEILAGDPGYLRGQITSDFGATAGAAGEMENPE